MKRVKLAPSLMCADLLNLQRDLSVLDRAADYYHIDIIDWHYCKNMCLAPCFVEAIHRVSPVPLDVHLYVDNVDADLIQLCIDSGASVIEVPADVVSRQVNRFARQIHSQGRQFGVFLNPADRLEMIEPYADLIDWLTVMTVDPGFAGQQFVSSVLPKLSQASRWKTERNCHYQIAVDGCCNAAYYRVLYEAGAEVFVTGSTGLFGLDREDLNHALEMALTEIERETAPRH